MIVGNDAGPGMAGPNQFADQGGSDGTLAIGWGSGYVGFFFGFCFSIGSFLISIFLSTANFTYLITVSISQYFYDTFLTLFVQPYEAIQARARKDRTSVSWLFNNFNLPLAASMAARKSAALVFINSDSGEGYITVDGNEGDRSAL